MSERKLGGERGREPRERERAKERGRGRKLTVGKNTHP